MITPRMRRAVAAASDGLPRLQTWIDRVSAIDPIFATAVDGVWCGSDGREAIDLPGTRSMLCVGWYRGHVEYSYLS